MDNNTLRRKNPKPFEKRRWEGGGDGPEEEEPKEATPEPTPAGALSTNSTAAKYTESIQYTENMPIVGIQHPSSSKEGKTPDGLVDIDNFKQKEDGRKEYKKEAAKEKNKEKKPEKALERFPSIKLSEIPKDFEKDFPKAKTDDIPENFAEDFPDVKFDGTPKDIERDLPSPPSSAKAEEKKPEKIEIPNIEQPDSNKTKTPEKVSEKSREKPDTKLEDQIQRQMEKSKERREEQERIFGEHQREKDERKKAMELRFQLKAEEKPKEEIKQYSEKESQQQKELAERIENQQQKTKEWRDKFDRMYDDHKEAKEKARKEMVDTTIDSKPEITNRNEPKLKEEEKLPRFDKDYRVATKIKPEKGEKETERDNEAEEIADCKESMRELERLESIFENYHTDASALSNWTEADENNSNDLMSASAFFKNDINFRNQVGNTSSKEMRNNQTRIDELQLLIFDEMQSVIDNLIDFNSTTQTSEKEAPQKIAVTEKGYLTTFSRKEGEKVEGSETPKETKQPTLKDDISKVSLSTRKTNSKSEVKKQTETKQAENHPYFENKTDVAIFDSDEKEKLIHENIKVGRGGVGYSVYQDGRVVIKSNKNSSIVSIPKELTKWIRLPESENQKIDVVVNVYCTDYREDNKEISKAKAKIYKTKYGIFLKLTENEKKLLFSKIERKQTIFVEVPTTMNGENQLIGTNKLKQAQQLNARVNFKDIKEPSLIATFEKENIKYNLYLCKKGTIFVVQKGRLGASGMFKLSSSLNRYLNDFFVNEPVIASLNYGKPMIIDTKFRSRKDGKLVKNLYFPVHQKESSDAEVLITNPNWQLKDDFKNDLKLKKLLNNYGLNIDFLTSNVVEEGHHKNQEIEFSFKKIMEIALSDNYDILPEVEILTPVVKNGILSYEKYLMDLLVAPKVELTDEMVIITEIKTSDGLRKQNELREGIFEVKHQQRKLGKEKILPIVVANADRKQAGIIQTNIYGLINGVLLIGKESLTKLQKDPQKITELIREANEKLKILNQYPEMTLHPITGELISINQLNNEAYDLISNMITSKIPKSISKDELLQEYTSLLGIHVHMLGELLEDLVGLTDKELFEFRTQDKEDIKSLHKLITDDKTIIVLNKMKKDDEDCYKIKENKSVFHKFIPLRIRIVDKKYAKNKGTKFEVAVKKEFEEKALTVVSNLVFTVINYEFEIDNIVIEECGITPVSCKDLSGYGDFAYLIDDIRDYANEIEHQTELLGADTGFLYVKVLDIFREKISIEIAKSEYKNVKIILK